MSDTGTPQRPATGTGVTVVGYARADVDAADLADRQRVLRAAGCARVHADETDGRQDDLPVLRDCLAALRAGDVLVVASLDQLGWTRPELIAAVEQVRRSGAGLRALREDLDTTGPGGAAIFRVFESLAGFGRAAISAGTSDGLAAARARGTRLGRPPALTPEQLREVRDLLLRPENTVTGVARRLGVSRSTLYKYLPEMIHAGAPGRPVVEPGDFEHGKPAGTAAAAHLAPYQARPGRRVLVIDDLADLRGPVEGSVELPLRLFWSLPDHRFELSDPDTRLWYYQTVLREASRAEDLTDYLDAATLASLWPDLYLPRGVRRAWEEHHPALRAKVSV
ncbi:MAG TPA: recombinase family protein [Trebonia sp.]|nr:recombinase family protein [Trebonia sp.]